MLECHSDVSDSGRGACIATCSKRYESGKLKTLHSFASFAWESTSGSHGFQLHDAMSQEQDREAELLMPRPPIEYVDE